MLMTSVMHFKIKVILVVKVTRQDFNLLFYGSYYINYIT